MERETDFVCPGRFHTNPPFEVHCQCENQIWVDPSCRSLFTCSGPEVGHENSGTVLTCPAGQVVQPNFLYPLEHECVPDEGQCPGWYAMGCDGGDFGSLAPECAPSDNPLGTCECDGQLFYNEDSTEAFACRSDVGGSGDEGCLLRCQPDQRVPLDFRPEESWRCLDREEEFNSPGRFHTDCESGFYVACGCEGEVSIFGARDCYPKKNTVEKTNIEQHSY